MISPKELKDKASRLFLKIVAGELKGEKLFPLVIPGNKQLSGANYNAWRDDLVPLYQHSKQQRGSGYSVEWKERKVAGISQQVPSSIFFESLNDFLAFTQKENEYEALVTDYRLLIQQFPSMSEWGLRNLQTLLESHDRWHDILVVCKYFSTHEPPHPYYLRELPVAVHSKFIEHHSGILRKMLDTILPVGWFRLEERDFSERYYLKSARILTQIRVLDENLKPYLGYDDCALSLDEAAWLKWKPKRVFIIENKACFLSFPQVKNAVAIFGEGFKSRLSQHFEWINDTDLYCWFDLDAAGFEILNLIRQHYSHAKSLMMDQSTFQQFSHYAVKNKHRRKQLETLLESEKELYDYLLSHELRLEQERLTHTYIQDQISKL